MHVCVIVRRGRESPLRSAVDLRFRRGLKIMKNQPRGVENQRKPEAGRVLGGLGAVLGHHRVLENVSGFLVVTSSY